MSLRQHLIDRGLDPGLYNVFVDEAGGQATLWLYNLSGQIVGYQQYNPSGTKSIRNDEKHRDSLKYFTYVGDEGDGALRAGKKKLAVWGLETVSMESRVIFLAEGVFDAVKLHNVGLPAIAVLANDPLPLRPFLFALGKSVIAVCDDDDAGKRLGSLAHVALRVPAPYHDLGEMPQDEVLPWLKSVFIGL
jgi:hypothetical protein